MTPEREREKRLHQAELEDGCSIQVGGLMWNTKAQKPKKRWLPPPRMFMANTFLTVGLMLIWRQFDIPTWDQFAIGFFLCAALNFSVKDWN